MTPPPLGETTPNPGVYPLEDTGEVEKQRISSAALHRISCSRVGALSSVALFRCIFSFGMFFGIIRVYTVLFSDPWMLLFEFCGIKFHLKDTSLLFNNRIYSGLHRFISPLI